MGGAGAMGGALVGAFARAGWRTVSVDFVANSDACSSVLLNSAEASASSDMADVVSRVTAAADGAEVGAVINAAGSWMGGDIGGSDIMTSVEGMWRANVGPSVSGACCVCVCVCVYVCVCVCIRVILSCARVRVCAYAVGRERSRGERGRAF